MLYYDLYIASRCFIIANNKIKLQNLIMLTKLNLDIITFTVYSICLSLFSYIIIK